MKRIHKVLALVAVGGAAFLTGWSFGVPVLGMVESTVNSVITAAALALVFVYFLKEKDPDA